MPIKEVCSPISRPGSKLSGNIPGSSPGAKSNPSGASGARFDSVPAQASHTRMSLSEEGRPTEVTIVGPSPEE
jgi:hypothetical protein